MFSVIFFFQAEDGIRDLVRSRGLGDVYKRQVVDKGADIFQFLHKPSDTEFMLHTPRGLRPPAVQLSLIHI